MTTYNAGAVADSTIAFQNGVTLQQGRALRDNPLAMFEGASGAPRLLLPAIENPNPGNVIRSRIDAEVTNDTTAIQVAHEFAFVQTGGVRMFASHRASAGASSVLTFQRWRNGSYATIATWTNATTTYEGRTVDIGVIPGDVLIIAHNLTSLSVGYLSYVANCRFMTNGESLWPVGPYVRIE